ncbi:CBS domain-containing protein [Methylocapsa sp. D3K7]|uniref:CBS domain-containing protein n=1 Tax=Methylocapsa sp. D3K7 TaxID=3041435 RepID=UPI00244E7847|nr:CBS domain-containing protein [Methylocapsa sp. D3K7]WGJ14746.1 CBS domain-containing protein [Methylocapsa sp. D3K7]
MIASDVMVHDIVTIGPEEDVSKAVKLLVDHDISALPVVDDERRVIGILSEADLLHRDKIGTEQHRAWWLEAVTPASVLALDYAKSHGRKVAEVMSEDVISADEDTPLSELANILEKNRIKRVPILKDGKLVGIVSRSNLIQALASAPSQPENDQLADRGIRSVILARLAEQSWTDFGERNIVVTNGVVNLWGLVGSPEEHKALLALAESVPGVREVSDEMIASYSL